MMRFYSWQEDIVMLYSLRIIRAKKDAHLGSEGGQRPSANYEPLNQSKNRPKGIVNDPIPGETRFCAEEECSCGKVLHSGQLNVWIPS